MAGYILKDGSGNPLPVAGEGTTTQSGAAYTYDSSDGNVVICTNTAYQTITLSTAASAANKAVTFKDGNKGWGSNPSIIVPNGSETIDGGASAFCDVTNSEITLISDGSNWFKTSGSVDAFQCDNSLALDGVDDYATVGDNSALDITVVSISAWIYPTSGFTSAHRPICAKRIGVPNRSNYQLYLNMSSSGAISWFSTNSSGSSYDVIVSSTVPTADTWCHVAATLDSSGNLAIYHNGSSVHTATVTHIATNAGDFSIGRNGSSNDEWFKGNIAQVGIWNSELTSSNITTLYNSGTPIDPRRVDYANLAGAWFCGDGTEGATGSTIYDMSANSNNLTLANGAAFSTDSP